MAKLGLFGVTIPGTIRRSAVPGEEIAYAMLACTNSARPIFRCPLPVYYLLNLAELPCRAARNDTIENELLPHVAKGEWFLGIATTEASGGSDLARNQNKRGKTYVSTC